MTDAECDMTKCKSIALETGRFISELSLKIISQPSPSISSDTDIDRLDNLIAGFRNSCLIKDEDMDRINRNFLELKNISPTARGTRLIQPLVDLISEINFARSECSCQKL